MSDSVDKKMLSIIEAALFAAGKPLDLERLAGLFEPSICPGKPQLRKILAELSLHYAVRGIELVEVASGWRFQSRQEFAPWIQRLWDEKPSRYSRASLETLALIVYRQPVTRAEIEAIRGVSVSSNIIKSMLEREWVRVVGHRDVPGRPALYATTRMFLDYFSLKSLEDLPTLAEIRDLDALNPQLELRSANDKLPEAEMVDTAASHSAAVSTEHETEVIAAQGVAATTVVEPEDDKREQNMQDCAVHGTASEAGAESATEAVTVAGKNESKHHEPIRVESEHVH